MFQSRQKVNVAALLSSYGIRYLSRMAIPVKVTGSDLNRHIMDLSLLVDNKHIASSAKEEGTDSIAGAAKLVG